MLEDLTLALGVGDATLALEALTAGLAIEDAALVLEGLMVVLRVGDAALVPAAFAVLSFCKEEAVDAFCVGAGAVPEINFWVDDGLPASEKPFAEDFVLEDDPWAADGVPKGVPGRTSTCLR